jgi:hypothetical protein
MGEPFYYDTSKANGDGLDGLYKETPRITEELTAGIRSVAPGFGNDEYAAIFTGQLYPGVSSANGVVEGVGTLASGVQTGLGTTSQGVVNADEASTELGMHLG